MMRWLAFFVACLCMPATANAAWYRAESQNFLVYMEARERTVVNFVETLERFNYAMTQIARVEQEEEPVKLRVFVVDSPEIVQSFWRGASIALGGFYRPVTRGPFTVMTEPRRLRGPYAAMTYSLLFHEYAHHFMTQHYPANYPGWYVEGYAEFYGQLQLERDDEIKIGGVNVSNGLLLHNEEWIPLEEMLSNRADLSSMLYAQAWLFFHYAFFDRETLDLLTGYLTLMQEGEPAEHAYRETFGATGIDYDEVLQQYRDDGIPSGIMTLENVPEFWVRTERITDAEAEIALLYPTESVEGLALAEQAAADHPDIALAHVELARLRLDDGDIAGALAAADRALEIDPDDLEANLYKGIVLTEMALDSADDDSPHWAEARDYIARANRIFPNNAFALYSYYQAYPDDDARPEIADRALERALELVPQSTEIRAAMIEELINQRRYADARRAIVPLMQTPHGVDNSAMARSMLESLENHIERLREYDAMEDRIEAE